jgi:chloramphenicol 3-O-phosphotransferase
VPFRLVVLFGRPGVGKLTIARHLAERTDYRLFHNHLTVDLALALFEFGSPGFVELREEIWLTALSRAAVAEIPGVIFTFSPESTVRETFLARLQESIRGAGGHIHLVEVTCAPEELRRRLTKPNRAEYGKLRDIATYEALEAEGHFDRPAMPKPHHLVDTTRISAAEAAESIAEVLAWSAPA